MSIKQISEVFDDIELKGNEKLLMLALADSSNENGVCFPSWNTLMKKTSMGRTTLSRWLSVLEEKGLLFRKQRNRDNGSKTSNKFLIYPYYNKEKLDEEEYIFFKELYTHSTKSGTSTVPKVELPHSVKSGTRVVPKVELPKVPKVELLYEPSLINRHLNPSVCEEQVTPVIILNFYKENISASQDKVREMKSFTAIGLQANKLNEIFIGLRNYKLSLDANKTEEKYFKSLNNFIEDKVYMDFLQEPKKSNGFEEWS